MKLFAQADESVCASVCVCVYSAATMCHKSLSDAAHVRLCVIMCVGVHQHGSSTASRG